MDIEQIEKIVKSAVMVSVDGRKSLICVLDEDSKKLTYACSDFGKAWIKKLNMEETDTIQMSGNSSYSITKLSDKQRSTLNRFVEDMRAAKDHTIEQMENNIFDSYLEDR